MHFNVWQGSEQKLLLKTVQYASAVTAATMVQRQCAANKCAANNCAANNGTANNGAANNGAVNNGAAHAKPKNRVFTNVNGPAGKPYI